MTTTHDTNDRPTSHQQRDDTHHGPPGDLPHRGYILAVKEALTLRGLSVTVAHVSGVAVWHADLELATADRQTAVLLRWDELTGWSCQTRGAHPTSAIAFGVSAVPLPVQIAAWVASVLAHPTFRARRARGLFVTPDLATRLARYHTSSVT